MFLCPHLPQQPWFRIFAPFLTLHFPLHLCGSLCQWIFCFFDKFQLISHYCLLFSVQLYQSFLLLLLFFIKETQFFCSYLLYLGLLFSALRFSLLYLGLLFSALGFSLLYLDFYFLHWDFLCFIWDFSLLDFPIRLDLGWVLILLLLLLCIGFWKELADQGEAQWSPTSLASLYECPPVAIGPLSGHSV